MVDKAIFCVKLLENKAFLLLFCCVLALISNPQVTGSSPVGRNGGVLENKGLTAFQALLHGSIFNQRSVKFDASNRKENESCRKIYQFHR
jgi:hypothetical protein